MTLKKFKRLERKEIENERVGVKEEYKEKIQ